MFKNLQKILLIFCEQNDVQPLVLSYFYSEILFASNLKYISKDIIIWIS